jgi:hypothetical protein
VITAISILAFVSAGVAILRPSIPAYFAAAGINAVAGWLVFSTLF